MIERLTTSKTPAIAANAVAKLMDAASSDALEPMIGKAVQLLERRHGVILGTASFRWGFKHVPADGVIELPLSPVQVITAVACQRDGKAVELAGWRNKERWLALPLTAAGCTGQVEFVAGYETVPHLVLLSIAHICCEWLEKPALHAAGETAASTVHARHYMEALSGKHRERQWQ
jgi:hypothetical protein